MYEEVPVVDESGNVVKDENGNTVTQKVPATSKSNSNSNNNSNSNSSQQKPNGNGSSGNSGSSSGSTSKPQTNTTSKPTQKPSKPTEKPTKPTEKPTEKPTKPTEKPTKPTEPEKTYGIDHFVNYAISYGKSQGLKYDSSITPESGSWDNPMTMKIPVVGEDDRGYYEKRIRTAIARLIREGDTVFWVYSEVRNGDRYNLYIGY